MQIKKIMLSAQQTSCAGSVFVWQGLRNILLVQWAVGVLYCVQEGTLASQAEMMEIDELVGADPNTLPYFVVEARTGKKVAVRFAPVTAADEFELRGEDWSQAVFRDVWPALVGEPNTFKLARIDGENVRIEGMVRIGRMTRWGGTLQESLLEAAPSNRHIQQQPLYRGIGRVLVARLVVESILHGGQGRVAVHARTGTEAFYRRLGFQEAPVMRLRADDAGIVVRAALYERPED